MAAPTSQTPAPTDTGMPPAPPPTRPGREPPSRTGALSLGIVLLGAGTLWLLAALGVDLPVEIVAPVLLLVIGVGVIVAGVRGEDGLVVGLGVFVGVWLVLATLVSAVVDVPLAGAVGEREMTPATVADVESDSRMFAGNQVLDLRDLELPEGTTEIALSVVLGELEVVVPEDMAVSVDARTAAGTVELFDEPVDGVGLSDEEETPGYSDAASRVDLELRVGLGQVVVHTR